MTSAAQTGSIKLYFFCAVEEELEITLLLAAAALKVGCGFCFHLFTRSSYSPVIRTRAKAETANWFFLEGLSLIDWVYYYKFFFYLFLLSTRLI
jgi:hypothetical protein